MATSAAQIQLPSVIGPTQQGLGNGGDPTPQDLPPGEEPKTPYVVFAPPTMPGGR